MSEAPARQEHLVLMDGLVIVTCGLSVVLNVLLLVCNHRRGKERWSTDGILIAMNGVFDGAVSAYLLSAAVVRLAYPELVYDGSTWCAINFLLERVLGTFCLDLVMLLALARYLVIVRRHHPSPRLWTCAALAILLVLFGITAVRTRNVSLAVYPSGMYCYPVAVSGGLATQLVSYSYLLFSVPPLLAIPFCYFRISRHYRRLISDASIHEVAYEARRKIRGMLVVVVAYWVVVSPTLVVLVAGFFFRRMPSPVVDGLAYYSKCLFLIINALFPIFLLAEIQDQFLALFRSRPAHYC